MKHKQEEEIEEGTIGCDIFFNNTNTNQVFNNSTGPIVHIKDDTRMLCALYTYHWNNRQGKPGGTIGLKNIATNQIIGPFIAVSSPGHNNAPNVNWHTVVSPRVVLAPGKYEVVDSDPQTWSKNVKSGNVGFCKIWLEIII